MDTTLPSTANYVAQYASFPSSSLSFAEILNHPSTRCEVDPTTGVTKIYYTSKQFDTWVTPATATPVTATPTTAPSTVPPVQAVEPIWLEPSRVEEKAELCWYKILKNKKHRFPSKTYANADELHDAIQANQRENVSQLVDLVIKCAFTEMEQRASKTLKFGIHFENETLIESLLLEELLGERALKPGTKKELKVTLLDMTLSTATFEAKIVSNTTHNYYVRSSKLSEPSEAADVEALSEASKSASACAVTFPQSADAVQHQ